MQMILINIESISKADKLTIALQGAVIFICMIYSMQMCLREKKKRERGNEINECMNLFLINFMDSFLIAQ